MNALGHDKLERALKTLESVKEQLVKGKQRVNVSLTETTIRESGCVPICKINLTLTF